MEPSLALSNSWISFLYKQTLSYYLQQIYAEILHVAAVLLDFVTVQSVNLQRLHAANGPEAFGS